MKLIKGNLYSKKNLEEIFKGKLREGKDFNIQRSMQYIPEEGVLIRQFINGKYKNIFDGKNLIYYHRRHGVGEKSRWGTLKKEIKEDGRLMYFIQNKSKDFEFIGKFQFIKDLDKERFLAISTDQDSKFGEIAKEIAKNTLLTYVEDVTSELPPIKKKISTYGFVRNQAVVEKILEYAKGLCENPYCNLGDKNFDSARGGKYLEVHHIKPLSDGGKDNVKNSIGLCALCHRKVHHGINDVSYYEDEFYKISKERAWKK